MTASPSFCVSVVICSYSGDRWPDLQQAVQSVYDQSVPAREIIVVVDHNPALLERVRGSIPGVTAVANSGRPGLRDARNSGIRAATGEIVAFLDDDAIASRDWCIHMLSAYDNPRLVGTGGSVDPLFMAGRPSWFPEEFDWVVGCSYRGLPQSATPVRNVFGVNMSFRRHVFDAAGNFHMGYSCDETEFCIRLRRVFPDSILLYNPAMKVEHRVPANRGRFSYFLRRCYFEGGSKAVIAHLWGTTDGLESERAYTLRTLPQGIARGIVDAVCRGDITGLQRAGAIVAGLLATAAGYLRAGVSRDTAAAERGWTGALEPQA